MDRRGFICSGCATIAALLGVAKPKSLEALETEEGYALGHQATYFEYLDNKAVQCHLCPWNCRLKPGQTGNCRTRYNNNGNLINYSYSNPCAVNIDPVEKKPLFHVLPGASAYSISTAGCNFRCKYCQNWQLSQTSPWKTGNFKLTPKDVVREAKANNCQIIAYTYGEPVTFYEYMLDTAILAKEAGMKNVVHSNAFIQEKPLRFLCKYIDAFNIDLKGMTDAFHIKITGGRAKPVLDSLIRMKEEGVFVEITRLLVTDENDGEEELKNTFDWIRDNLGSTTPLHLSRFFPLYQLTRKPATPVTTLMRARKQALTEGLKYVYVGNYRDKDLENTYCHKCNRLLVKRSMYIVEENRITSGTCPYCNSKIPGIFE